MQRFMLLLCCILVVAGTVTAQQLVFSANDLDTVQLTEKKEWGKVQITARSDKNVTIESMDVPREAPDGELFNNRIKLNGGGSLEYRAILFTVEQKGELVVYCNSSSKTDARTLVLADAKTGNVITQFSAEPDTGSKACLVKAILPDPGTYALYSKSGGINIYQIMVK